MHDQDMPHGRKLRILVVEDNADTVAITEQVLNLYGYEVHAARDGPSALQLAQAAPPDVALIDIGLPGMTGHEVARQLRAQAEAADKRPLLIAITGYGTEEDRQHSRAAGIDLHLVKPADQENLMNLLERFRALIIQDSECRR